MTLTKKDCFEMMEQLMKGLWQSHNKPMREMVWGGGAKDLLEALGRLVNKVVKDSRRTMPATRSGRMGITPTIRCGRPPLSGRLGRRSTLTEGPADAAIRSHCGV